MTLSTPAGERIVLFDNFPQMIVQGQDSSDYSYPTLAECKHLAKNISIWNR